MIKTIRVRPVIITIGALITIAGFFFQSFVLSIKLEIENDYKGLFIYSLIPILIILIGSILVFIFGLESLGDDYEK